MPPLRLASLFTVSAYRVYWLARVCCSMAFFRAAASASALACASAFRRASFAFRAVSAACQRVR